MDNKTKDAIKQLQAEVRQLHVLVAGRRPEGKSEATAPPEEAVSARTLKDAVVQYTVLSPRAGDGVPSMKTAFAVSDAQIARVGDESAAALGYALASPQKIALLRALLGKSSESAAALGEATRLSTGSLYHHLRELMRADLIHQAGRNRYELTARGTRVLLVVLALAAEPQTHA